ncbi:beta-eliminating lyase-related protein [Roseibacterium sp. SDUM158017]|uniref:threonine aldolase family protein n=1 Tax=Roseicyclus salinarum TaxID=3036773 RepID=UPI002415623D|nr:beta-eliminating lyase-related protein [Roseibacterium sp. SDUM158017]MDG4648301.1 beta-eliminating lyase-related protein [Roseibacterium sp. SDUM158017]
MNFASDNAGPAHPRVMEALARAGEGYAMPYGNDPVTADAVGAIRDLFEAPEAEVAFVGTGTAANALALSCLVRPFETVYCSSMAHIEEDECNAPEFFTGGAKMTLLHAPDGLIDPAAFAAALAATRDRGVHGAQAGALSITQITERGTAYSLAEIGRLADMARDAGIPVHLDGARFANACAALGCTAAEMTWKAGVDAVSFGGTKNGCLGVEAVVMFRPEHGRELALRRKRSGHLWSKQRYLSAQMSAYVEDGLWLEMAGAANAACARLAEAVRAVPSGRLAHAPAGNMIYADLPRAAHRRAMAAGAQYYIYPSDTPLDGPDDTPIRCRLVCDWSKPLSEIERIAAAWEGRKA